MPESHSSAGLGALAVRSAIRGAGPFDADQLALGFERLGGTLTPLVTSDWFGYGASVLASAAVEAAVLLDHVLCRPRLEAAEIERERTTLADEAVQAADDMVRFPMQLSLSGAFGQSGYGLPVQGLPESVPELSPGMVKAWHACELAQGRTTVVAVGDVDPDTLAGRLAGVFGEGPPRMAWVDPEALTRPVAAGPVMTVVERARKQTALAMFYPGPARRDPARHAAVVWAALSGGLGGRLFTALRDTRSLAYTVMASSWQRAAAGGLLLYLATSPGREAEARAALLEELGRFRNEDCHAGELSRSIGYLTGQSQVRRQTGSALAGEIADAWLIGEGLVEVAEPTAGIRAVTAAAVRALAGSYLQEGARAEGVVRGTAEERPEYVSGQPARERA
jgi:zinc protease